MALNGAMSLITIPIVTGIAGADHWASMATGQAIGASFAVIVIFGWGLTGPVTVAGTAVAARPAMYLDSLLARLVLLAPVLHRAARGDRRDRAASEARRLRGRCRDDAGRAHRRTGSSSARDARGGSSRSTPCPRVAGTLAGAALLAATGDLLLFAVAQLAGSLVALAASAA